MERSLSLIVLSAAVGVVLLWVFSRTSDQPKLRRTKKRLQAHLLELRLYADSPRIVLRAQKMLLRENLEYFAVMLRPARVVMPVMIVLLILLEGFYGMRPLAPGEDTVVTVKMAAPLAPAAAPPQLEAPAGIAVETPPVRDLEDNEVSWRIRARAAVSGKLRIVTPQAVLTKKITAGRGLHFLTSRRVRSLVEWPLHPGEARLPDTTVRWIEVAYPPAEVAIFGLRFHWLVWFLVISMGTALLLKRRFHVSF